MRGLRHRLPAATAASGVPQLAATSAAASGAARERMHIRRKSSGVP